MDKENNKNLASNCDLSDEYNVFILGAGFSKAINSQYPTLKELSSSINKRYKFLVDNKEECFDKATKLLAEYYFSLPNAIRNNFEHLLSYLSSSFPWKTLIDQNLDKALYQDILRQLLHEFEHLPNSFSDRCLALGTFINKSDATCLTFNYDLLLEALLSQSASISNVEEKPHTLDAGYKNYYKINLETFDVNNYLSNEYADNVLIHKLHGSINWIYRPNGTIGELKFNPRTNNYTLPEGYLPYIVPPVTDKSGFYNNVYLSQLWQYAKDALSIADNIYIIGYSFPKADLSSEFLMNFALQNTYNVKDWGKRVYFVNLKESSTIKNLCKQRGIELIQITCKDCPYYKKAGVSEACKECHNTPLDKLIKDVIAKKLNKVSEVLDAK